MSLRETLFVFVICNIIIVFIIGGASILSYPDLAPPGVWIIFLLIANAFASLMSFLFWLGDKLL